MIPRPGRDLALCLLEGRKVENVPAPLGGISFCTSDTRIGEYPQTGGTKQHQLSQNGKPGVAHIRDQHVRGRMSDAERRPGILHPKFPPHTPRPATPKLPPPHPSTPP